MIIPITALSLAALFFVACTEKSKPAVAIALNFNSLIEEQINTLSQRRYLLEKSAIVDGEQFDSTFVPSPDKWGAELDIFRQLEIINKPINKDSYLVVGPLDDPTSNLKFQQFTSDSSPLIQLRVYYQDEPNRTRKVVGEFAESNALYASSRNLTLEFDVVEGKALLIGYRIHGFQKVAWRDTMRFTVEGRINW